MNKEDVFGPSLGCLNVKDKGERSRSPGTKTAFSDRSAACVRFVFGKTSLAARHCLTD